MNGQRTVYLDGKVYVRRGANIAYPRPGQPCLPCLPLYRAGMPHGRCVVKASKPTPTSQIPSNREPRCAPTCVQHAGWGTADIERFDHCRGRQ
jgi:hypothetical protein